MYGGLIVVVDVVTGLNVVVVVVGENPGCTKQGKSPPNLIATFLGVSGEQTFSVPTTLV